MRSGRFWQRGATPPTAKPERAMRGAGSANGGLRRARAAGPSWRGAGRHVCDATGQNTNSGNRTCCRRHEVAYWDRRNVITWEDAMERWSAFVGDFSQYWGNYRWQRLGGTHDAAEDCLELLSILRLMAADAGGEHQRDDADAMAIIEPMPDQLAVG